MLDPSVVDWPMEDAMKLAKMGLQCAELRRKDRPDLGKVILPELNRLRDLAEDNNLISVLDNSMDAPLAKQVSVHLVSFYHVEKLFLVMSLLYNILLLT